MGSPRLPLTRLGHHAIRALAPAAFAHAPHRHRISPTAAATALAPRATCRSCRARRALDVAVRASGAASRWWAAAGGRARVAPAHSRLQLRGRVVVVVRLTLPREGVELPLPTAAHHSLRELLPPTAAPQRVRARGPCVRRRVRRAAQKNRGRTPAASWQPPSREEFLLLTEVARRRTRARSTDLQTPRERARAAGPVDVVRRRRRERRGAARGVPRGARGAAGSARIEAAHLSVSSTLGAWFHSVYILNVVSRSTWRLGLRQKVFLLSLSAPLVSIAGLLRASSN